MSYRWQVEESGAWVDVAAAALPETLRSKKSVMWAGRGTPIEARARDGVTRRYRLVAGAREQGTPR